MTIQTNDDYAPWLRTAKRFNGLREIDDQGELSPAVTEFFLCTRFPPALVNKRTPWCAAFVCAVLEQHGIAHPRSARARDFLGWGQELLYPVPGAVLVFERGQMGKQGHVAFCDLELATWNQSTVRVLGGNQDNAVCSRRYEVENLLSARWPVGWPLPPGAVTP
jgi:uncharacterized protein (TIGR02594 family)